MGLVVTGFAIVSILPSMLVICGLIRGPRGSFGEPLTQAGAEMVGVGILSFLPIAIIVAILAVFSLRVRERIVIGIVICGGIVVLNIVLSLAGRLTITYRIGP